jgi:hypothetical protein
MKGNQGSQAIRFPRPLNYSSDKRLMAAVQAIERANGQDRFLSQAGLGQIINYLHSLPFLGSRMQEMGYRWRPISPSGVF